MRNNSVTGGVKAFGASWLVALALSAGSSGTVFATDKCKAAISAVDELLAVHQIENLMARYSHLSMLEGEDKLEPLFAMKTEGVSWKNPMGPTGIEALKERFKTATPPEVRSVQLRIDPMLTPIVEIAKDGKTAIGVWDSFDHHVHGLDSAESELWVKYGVDFIKEDGQWKIWHLQVYPVYDTPADKTITQTVKERAAQAEARAAGGSGGGNRPPGAGPRPDWSGPKGGLWMYDGKSLPRGPKIPEPYCTFDPTTSN